MATSRPEACLHDQATELVRQLQRNSDIIPPFNRDLLKDCISKINKEYSESFNQLTEVRAGRVDPASSQRIAQVTACRSSLIMYAQRCCNAYLHERMNRIKQLRWKFGGVLPAAIRANLDETEIQFFNEYSSSLADYQASLGENGVNLMFNVEPPKTLFIQVKVLQNYGEFETSDGTVVILQKNSIHSLPRQDCEMLIKQGYLEMAN